MIQRVDVRNLPSGESWWCDGEVVRDDRGDLWGADWWAPGPWEQVTLQGDRFEARDGVRRVVGTAAAANPGPEPPLSGRDFPDWTAPQGARRSPWFWQADGVCWWWDSGTLYRRDPNGIAALLVLERPPELVPGPGGVALIDGTWIGDTRLCRLSRSVSARRWVRFGPEGCGAWADEAPAWVGLDGDVRAVEEIAWGPVRAWRPRSEPPGPAVLNGTLLAGPGDGVWDLTTGTRIGTLPVGLFAAFGDGFSVVPRDGGVVSWCDPRGAVWGESRLDLAPDVVTRIAEGPVAVTAEGRAWRLAPTGSVRTERPRPVARRPAGGRIPIEGGAEVDRAHWGWRSDGLLVRLHPDET